MAVDSTKILAAPAEVLADFYDRTEFCAEPARVRSAMDAVRRHGGFHPREWAEQTESVRQVIPCVVVRNGARLLCVRRARKGREDLRLRYTLLFGGHVDADDSNGSRERVLHRCAERELREELGLNSTVSPDPVGVVVDLATASSRRHFGVVFECRITGSVVNVRRGCDNSEFTHSRRDNDYRLEEAGEFAGRKFDPWSELLLASPYARQHFGALPSTFAAQLPLELTAG